MGWDLPTVRQLMTLVTPRYGSGPFLPIGSPFENVQAAEYWTATAAPPQPPLGLSMMVTVRPGNPSDPLAVRNYTDTIHVFGWCVRGGQKTDRVLQFGEGDPTVTVHHVD